MKLGLVSAVLADYTFEQVVDYVGGAGLECVELMCWPVGKAERRYAGVTHIDVSKMDKGRAEYIKGYANDKKVEISALGYYPNPLDPDPEKRELFVGHLKKVVTAAGMLGVPNVNTMVGKDQYMPFMDSLVEFKKVWPDIVKHAEDSNVKIAIEFAPMYYSRDEWPSGKNLACAPRMWDEMFSIIDSKNFGLNYDPTHMVSQLMDYIRPVYDYAEKIFHFHIKDAKVYKERFDYVGILATPGEYHKPKLPGLGDIDWGRTLSALYDIGYNKWGLIEIEDRAFEGSLEDRLHAIRIAQHYMRNFI